MYHGGLKPFLAQGLINSERLELLRRSEGRESRHGEAGTRPKYLRQPAGLQPGLPRVSDWRSLWT